MKLVILDGHALNPGDLSWDAFKEFGEITLYDRTSPDKVVERIGDAELILTNKVTITDEIMSACKNLKYIGVLATGYNIIDINAAKKTRHCRNKYSFLQYARSCSGCFCLYS